MNPSTDVHRTEEEAAGWLIRLDAGPSAAMHAQFQEWLEADARHRAAYLRLESGWRGSDVLKNLRPLNGTVDLNLLNAFPDRRRARAPVASPTLYRALATVMSFVSLVLAAWILLTHT